MHCRASDIRAQEQCGPGVRTRIRSGALPPTAGCVALTAEAAAQPPVVQVSASKAAGTRRCATSYSIRASAVAVDSAEESLVSASSQAASVKVVITAEAPAASESSGNEAAHLGRSRADARGQGKAAAPALLGAKAKMSRFGRLLRGSATTAIASSPVQKQLSGRSKEVEAASLPEGAPDEAPLDDPRAAEGAGVAPVKVTADADEPVPVSATLIEKVRAEPGGRGRKRPSPKKAPGPLGFRARRAPRSELFSKDVPAAAKTGKTSHLLCWGLCLGQLLTLHFDMLSPQPLAPALGLRI